MNTNRPNTPNQWEEFYGPNLGYVIELYEQYKDDPDSVDPTFKELFEQWGAPALTRENDNAGVIQAAGITEADMMKVASALKLMENIRAYGHLSAEIYPFDVKRQKKTEFLNPATYGLTENDLQSISAKILWSDAPSDVKTGLDAVNRLKELYTKSLSYEFSHVHEAEERNWLTHMVESGSIQRSLSNEERVHLLRRLTEVEGFEQFLHKTFVGQKRFSIEGVDVLVPMLDDIIFEGVRDGAKNVMIGMAHRGRLNVLAHVLGKPYEIIFSEFHHSPNKELVPSEGSKGINYGWTGDVKYHLGGVRAIKESNSLEARLTLANNPSHLEFVNPVVEGYTRAAQEDRTSAGFPQQDVQKSFAILIHGDAAFPGEGIVAETLNLSRLRGFQTGGTVHIIANNLIGFTTDSADSRSTKYASDLAKGFEIPIVHVNADDPEACLTAMHLAYQYRKRFNKDFLIDLVGYRRYGHNEMDDPHATQPYMYGIIDKHPTVKKLYGEVLQAKGILSAEEIEKIEQEVQANLQAEYEKVKKDGDQEFEEPCLPEKLAHGLPDVDTAVPFDELQQLNNDLLARPEGFTVYPKLDRILKRRRNALEEGGKIDWGHAETLAFASILKDGTPIRLTGQDSERGTFAHRHIVLNDSKTGEKFSPMHALPSAKASFAVHNSPLSETSVVGFEYGYNVYAPETLVLWEAQFGDFANVAQVIFDQFVSAGRAKWGQKSGLVLLLPHGYEGQGPEHSSARLERYLQLAAENNWTVANLTSAAQYFHILRRQAAILEKDEVRPLVIMTPKSLLRNPRAASTALELSNGHFYPVLEQEGLGKHADQVERLILCSGKVAIDLATEIEAKEENFDWLHIARVEELYPFPEKEIQAIISRFANLKEIVWVQEEPKNMGSWMYIEPRIRAVAPENVSVDYIGRPDRSSTASGDAEVHKKEQAHIMHKALTAKIAVNQEGGHGRG